MRDYSERIISYVIDSYIHGMEAATINRNAPRTNMLAVSTLRTDWITVIVVNVGNTSLPTSRANKTAISVTRELHYQST
jgi:hypothetical protein